MRSSVTAILEPAKDSDSERTDRVAAASEAPEAPGVIGKRYEVQALLGQGGMGAVYRARDRLTGQLVALKRVALSAVGAPLAGGTLTGQPPTALAEDSTVSGPRAQRVALAQEFRTLAALRHPNIVSVLDYGFDEQHLPFFTMEYLERPHNLLLAGLELPLSDKLELIAQLLRALTYLHRHGILHRDLKPSNVLVVRDTQGLRLKVLDFGIAVQVGAASDIAGTTAYMAPEVRKGEPPAPAADLYAVGVILYQMLSRKVRKEQGHTVSLAAEAEPVEQTEMTLSVPLAKSDPVPAEQSSGQPESGSGSVDAWLPSPELVAGPLGAVVARLVEPDPKKRYPDAAAVLHDLSAVMSEIAARPLTPESVAARDSFLLAAGLVGRERELGELEAAMRSARRGVGSVILLGGESGAGKSRLLEELRTTALVRGVPVLRGQAVSDGGTAYQIFADILPQLVLRHPPTEEEAGVLKELLRELPTLLGRSIADAASLPPQEARRRLHQVLLATLTRCSEPAVLLLEDLHWAALESLELLKEVAAQAAQLPLLVVASYRDDERADLPRLLPAATVLKLPRLGESAIAALSCAMLGAAGSRPGLVAFLNRETEGNVLFIVEVVRALAEEAGSLDAVGLRELPQQVVSGGVSAVLRRRLDRVPEWARPLLRAVAVAGRQVDLAVFSALEPRLQEWLQACLDAAVLEVNDAQWRFSHDKLREALLAALSAEEKERLHRRIGETIEQVHGDSGAHQVALAYHFEQAGDLPKAARLTAQAGAAALRRGSLHEAVALLQRAEKLQEQVGAPLLERTATLRRLVRAYYAIDRRVDCVTACRKGMALLGHSIPQKTTPRMLALAREAGVELKNRVVGAAVTPDEEERVAARELVALVKATGDLLFDRVDIALLAMLFSLHAAEKSGDEESQVNHLSWLAYAAYCIPWHGLGKLYLSRAAVLLQKQPQSWLRSDYHPFAGYIHFGEGNWNESIESNRLWLKMVQQTGQPALQCLANTALSGMFFASGRLADALHHGESCLEIARRIDNGYFIGVGLASRGMVQYYRGHLADAGELLGQAQQYIARNDSQSLRLTIGGISALVALRLGQSQLAVDELDKVLALMARTPPPSPQHVEGYYATLEVALHLYLHAQTAGERTLARRRLSKALYHHLRFAHKFPIAGPRALLAIARLVYWRGQARLADRILQLCLRSATRRAMPYEQALAHLWIGRLALEAEKAPQDRARARLHLDAAEKLLTDGGYQLDLPEVRGLFSRL